MQARSVERVPLNARVTRQRRKAFDIAVARRGITTQKAVEEALDLWLARFAPKRVRGEVQLPLIEAAGHVIRDVTGEQVDELLG